MILLVFVLLSVAVGLCWFGKLKNLADVELRFLWAPAAAAFAELSMLLFHRLLGAGFAAWSFAPLLLSYALLLLFLLGNLRLRGTVLMAAGALMNLAVIAANGFKMPVSAVPEAGMTEYQSLRYALIDGGTRLPFLADVIKVPLPLIGGYASAGDVVMAAGAALFFLFIMRPAGGYFSGIRKI